MQLARPDHVRRRFGRSLGLCLTLFTALASAQLASAAVIYVKAGALGTANGTSWTDAYPSLQTALATAQSGDEIWVAAGTYKPTTGTDRTISFAMKDGINLYGGFSGTDETTRTQRNWTAYETILSGDIGASGTDTDNSYHVVVGASGILDGFTITYGNANGPSGYPTYYENGGGMINGIAKNCIFSVNQASFKGGGMRGGIAINCTFINNAAKDGGGQGSGTAETCIFISNKAQRNGAGVEGGTATNCIFTSNTAQYGGGIEGDSAINCVFFNNSAYQGGGAFHTPVIIHCTFVANTATYGGGLAGDRGNILNSIFWGNVGESGSQIFQFPSYYHYYITGCDIQGSGGSGTAWDSSIGSDNGFNCDLYPSFTDIFSPTGLDGTWCTNDDGLTLKDGSPCINSAADIFNFAKPDTDILGNPIVSHVADIGAYENQTPIPVAQMEYDIYPDSYLTVLFGSTPPKKTFIIKNIGTDDLLISNVIVNAPFSIVKPPDGRVAVGTSTTLVVSMSTEKGGTYTGSVSFSTNDPAYRTFTRYIGGKVLAPVTSVLSETGVSIHNGGSVRLRTAEPGAVAPKTTLTIRNDGDSTLTLGIPAIDPPLVITAMPSTIISAGSGTTIDLSMNTVIIGSFSEPLTFTTNDPNATTYSITVNGIIQSTPKVLYVKADSAATSNTPNLGISWATAYPDLQMAIAAAKAGNEIWVAAGTYKPTAGTDRSISFVMSEDVVIYGGFRGTETSIKDRKFQYNATILSGEIGTTSTSDNSYHVIVGGNYGSLDGFTITGGKAYGHIYDGTSYGGGGMINDHASPSIRNCIFDHNAAGDPAAYFSGVAPGGGIYNVSASPMITNCMFFGNTSNASGGLLLGVDGQGGAIFNDSKSSPKIVNCVFLYNSAVGGCGSSSTSSKGQGGAGLGGAIFDAGSGSIVNCTFIWNRVAGGEGGGIGGGRTGDWTPGMTGAALGSALYIEGGSRTVTNCIFWIDSIYKESGTVTFKFCDIQNAFNTNGVWNKYLGTDGGGNFSIDPKFVDTGNIFGPDHIWFTADDGLRLQVGSPCIDTGTPLPTPPHDILGKPRVYRNDLGAYEFPLQNGTVDWVFYR